MSKSQKYFTERLCRGGDCTARSQWFIYAPAAENVASMFSKERINEAICKIKKLKINGVRSLVSKADVIEVLNLVKKHKFNKP
jgi:hypothetical protein